jgi:predicted DsbA family dithiol-disulfide isomerase
MHTLRADERAARALGISGVPFFLIGGRHGVAGAQPAEVLHRALDAAWEELALAPTDAAGPLCGPDGCT